MRIGRERCERKAYPRRVYPDRNRIRLRVNGASEADLLSVYVLQFKIDLKFGKDLWQMSSLNQKSNYKSTLKIAKCILERSEFREN